MPHPPDYQAQIERFEKIMDAFYRRDPVEASNDLQRHAVEEFNAWAERQSAELDRVRVTLEEELGRVRAVEREIDALGERLRERPDRSDGAAVEAFNRIVAERNAVVDRQRALAKAYDEHCAEYNDRVHAHAEESRKRRAQVEEEQRRARTEFETYRRWMDDHGPEHFAEELSGLYATLHERVKAASGAEQIELEEALSRVRGLRRELAEHAKRQEETRQHAVLMVDARLCGTEDALMVVDTGASSASISPQLVSVLGLTDRLGDEVEVRVAGGCYVRGRQLVLPSVSVGGREAQNVEGIVLKSSTAGVDGCLGMSFLNRFLYHIENGQPPRLYLRLHNTDSDRPEFDVFISHKSDDFPMAKQVFDVLTKLGLRAFLSEISLPRLGDTAFLKAIDGALECARHLLVVATSRTSIDSSWVDSEWRIFVGLKHSGRKSGNVLTVMGGQLTVRDLPPALSQYEAIRIESPDLESRLADFLR